MKNWENRLSAALLIMAGIVLLAILACNLWIFPPGKGLSLVSAESSADISAEEPSMPGPLNLNTATEKELDTLPGIGEALARRIVEYREEHGGFRAVEELMEISGIGDATFSELRDKVTID